MDLLIPNHVPEPVRRELAAMCREVRRVKESIVQSIFRRLAVAIAEDRPLTEDESDAAAVEEERLDEATERLAEWLSDHDVNRPILCDGWYYLHHDGELLVVQPEAAIDVGGDGAE